MALMSKEHEMQVISFSISVKTCITCMFFVGPRSNIYQFFFAIMVTFDFFKLVMRLAKQLVLRLNTVPAQKTGKEVEYHHQTSYF